ncbi:MAG: hypothetical protein LBV23_05710 [Deltaproteobacteria bacterium]|jgi:mannose-6-phosphate isomerase class I|nr:hypothetical protein [Deltaproteobacteria bacterium]
MNKVFKAQVTSLALEPVVAERPWGSKAHASFNWPAKAESRKWGEIWMACEDFGIITKVCSGPDTGQTLSYFQGRWGKGLSTPKNGQKNVLPISLRLERTGDEPGPVRVISGEEFWYVLESSPESWLAAGASDSLAPWPERLLKISPEPGDRLVMPGGLPRCQGPNMTVLKALESGAMVQTLYDWERQPDVFDFSPPPKDLTIEYLEPPTLKTICEGRDRILYQGPLYKVTLVNTNFFSSRGDGALALICPVKGRGRVVTSGANEAIRLHPGQAIVVPAGVGRYSVESGTIISYLFFQLNK